MINMTMGILTIVMNLTMTIATNIRIIVSPKIMKLMVWD